MSSLCTKESTVKYVLKILLNKVYLHGTSPNFSYANVNLQKGIPVSIFPKLIRMEPLFQGAFQRPCVPEFIWNSSEMNVRMHLSGCILVLSNNSCYLSFLSDQRKHLN